MTDTVINSWPQISSMISQLDDIYSDLQPILSFLDDVQDKLNERVCLPNPAELLSESAEEVPESELVEEGLRFAAERAREAEALAAERLMNAQMRDWNWHLKELGMSAIIVCLLACEGYL